MPSVGIQPRVTYPLEGTGFAGPNYTGSDDPIRIAANGIDSSLLATLAPDPAGTYSSPSSITVNDKGQITAITAGAAGGSPTVEEDLNVSGASVSIPGIHNATTVLFFRNGALQHSGQYTISPNIISNADTDQGDFDDENLITVYW